MLKVPFTEYYNMLANFNPAKMLLVFIAMATNHSLASARKWASGEASPDPLSRKTIAEILGSTPEILFPEPKKKGRPNGKK